MMPSTTELYIAIVLHYIEGTIYCLLKPALVTMYYCLLKPALGTIYCLLKPIVEDFIRITI